MQKSAIFVSKKQNNLLFMQLGKNCGGMGLLGWNNVCDEHLALSFLKVLIVFVVCDGKAKRKCIMAMVIVLVELLNNCIV